MLQTIPDPFDSYGPPQPKDQIFSILTPLSLSSTFPSPSASPIIGTPYSERRGHYLEQHPNLRYSSLDSQATTDSTASSVTGDSTQCASSPTRGSLMKLPPGSSSPPRVVQDDGNHIPHESSSYDPPSPLEQSLPMPAPEGSTKAVKGARKAFGRTAINPSLLVNTARSKTEFPSGTATEDDDEDRGQATPRFSTFFPKNVSSLSRIEGASASG